MPDAGKCYAIFAGLSGFCGVVLGALSAHKAQDAYAAGLLQQASLYQLVHSAVLLFLCQRKEPAARIACPLFALGILLFCGSLTVKALAGTAHAPLAPFGGGCLMLGWLTTAFLPFFRAKEG